MSNQTSNTPNTCGADQPQRKIKSPKQLTQYLIRALFEGNLTPPELVRETDISLSRLGQWAMEPQNAQVLAGLARLADVRAQLLVSSYRAIAAAALVKMASAEQPSDMARKACVDLLNTNLGGLESQELPQKPRRKQLSQSQALQIFRQLGADAGWATAQSTNRSDGPPSSHCGDESRP